MNTNSTASPDFQALQYTLNSSSNTLDYFFQRSTSNNSVLIDERLPSNTMFWLDDLLAKIDLMQYQGEKLGILLGNITLPTKAHCGNVGLSAYNWRVYNLFLVLIQYFIPLIVITFAYTKMGLKLRETGKRMDKRNSSKLQRINTTSSGGGFSSSSVRTTNNNLIVSPGTPANYNMQMAIELQQAGQTNQIINTLQSKRCRSLDCQCCPPEETLNLQNDRKCSQQTNTTTNLIQQQTTGRHSPQCIHHNPNNNINSPNVSIRSKQQHRTSICTADCCREMIILNNNNECLLNKNVSNSRNASIKNKTCGSSCKCKTCRQQQQDQQQNYEQQPCICTNAQNHHHFNSLHRNQSSPTQSPQHHYGLHPTGSIHSNLMMPIISHPISALRAEVNTEYIVINKKKVKALELVIMFLCKLNNLLPTLYLGYQNVIHRLFLIRIPLATFTNL